MPVARQVSWLFWEGSIQLHKKHTFPQCTSIHITEWNLRFDSPGSKYFFVEFEKWRFWAYWGLIGTYEYPALKSRNKLSVKMLCDVLFHIWPRLVWDVCSCPQQLPQCLVHGDNSTLGSFSVSLGSKQPTKLLYGTVSTQLSMCGL